MVQTSKVRALIALKAGGKVLGDMGWLRDHLETFVKPYLEYVPQEPLKYFTPAEMAVIKNLWKSVKSASEGKLLVLPGRDVFVFEVLARRENFRTLFIPECSRQTVQYYRVDNVWSNVPRNSFVFDTGFLGTIPRGMNVDSYKLASYADSRSDRKIQVFPRLTMSRHLALKIEGTPKYWETGKMTYDGLDDKPYQIKSDTEEFARAAALTIAIYKDSSPAFINKRMPLHEEVSECVKQAELCLQKLKDESNVHLSQVLKKPESD